jgi:hypothetical protein
VQQRRLVEQYAKGSVGAALLLLVIQLGTALQWVFRAAQRQRRRGGDQDQLG